MALLAMLTAPLGVQGSVATLAETDTASPRRPRSDRSILLEARPPTGEPDAGDPPVRFGGRGDRDHSVLPTPIREPSEIESFISLLELALSEANGSAGAGLLRLGGPSRRGADFRLKTLL